MNEIGRSEQRSLFHEQQSEYYQRHRERKLEYQKKYYQQHHEQQIAYQKEYREQNKERILKRQNEYNKSHYQSDKEQIRKQNNNYKQTHRKQIREQYKEYYQKNREKILKCNSEYKQHHREYVLKSNEDYRLSNGLVNRKIYHWQRQGMVKTDGFYSLYTEFCYRYIYQADRKCMICGKALVMKDTAANKGNIAYMDHDHKSGKIRGILCVSCNYHLGYYEENGFADGEFSHRCFNYLCNAEHGNPMSRSVIA